LSVDEDTVSLNAFEIFTRVKGFKEQIKKLFEDCVMRHKSQQSIKLNDQIVTELGDVKQLLD